MSRGKAEYGMGEGWGSECLSWANGDCDFSASEFVLVFEQSSSITVYLFCSSHPDRMCPPLTHSLYPTHTPHHFPYPRLRKILLLLLLLPWAPIPIFAPSHPPASLFQM